ncbi:MAG: glycerol-3-phosphate acyltransferase [candidate division WOR-3 bacterium]
MKIFVMLFLLEYFIGSLMFSYWLGKLSGKDITQAGDGNPGAYNLIKSAGFKKGFLGLALDYLKGFLPLYYIVENSQKLNLSECQLALICSAPLLGHAFSPFMKFKGGKALAVTFGVWSALTKWEVPVLMGFIFTFFLLYQPKMFDKQTWQSFAPAVGLAGILIYLLLKESNLTMWIVWTLNSFVVLLKFYFLPALNRRIAR